MKIAIQGAAGSFHHEAALKLMGQEPFELVPCTTFADVFAAVKAGQADQALVAVENNIYGSINEIYRLFERYDVWVSAEVRLQIRQQLIGPQQVSLSELQQAGSDVHILSQAPALAQVEVWLDTNLPAALREETHDTADSVRMVVASGNKYHLAVAGEQAAQTYGGTIVAMDITDEPGNYTRFFMFSKQPQDVSAANACSLILRTDHSPGALVRALQLFAKQTIGLSRLDSHPVVGDEQHYRFYIDADASVNSAAMQTILAGLAAQNCEVRVLGSYRRAE